MITQLQKTVAILLTRRLRTSFAAPLTNCIVAKLLENYQRGKLHKSYQAQQGTTKLLENRPCDGRLRDFAVKHVETLLHAKTLKQLVWQKTRIKTSGSENS